MAVTTEAIADAASAVLQDDGLDALTLRAVADRLGVRHNSVRWHVGNKQGLLELLSERIVAPAADADLPAEPHERLTLLWERLRGALLAHRDGARLLSGLTNTGPHALTFADASVGALKELGRDPRTAVWLHWSVFYFVLGLTIEQQTDEQVQAETVRAAVATGPYPNLSDPETSAHLTADDFDQRFAFGLRALLNAPA
ncbi:TetR/AcrR family transcriptional regulator C-terminal domain-containing protein [Streptomyces sp. PTM05]|uniref:TetR/AcrR family transcriptional regulator C-terminal domain-containing protein n=1 Tax=Streptantibioticus parmotrematis TaxID=2873249 RepID=A0ABS7QP65_9ACTN|nr:TetR/AcrR family transcriptional regulator C-terminal domain-containing protein [Streptantibioticus parmotrematis]MBY8883604.1 TetR/AcrR family transcriptional regulator C-terminal domain-containing protein [Streptantibioticus parmotrematis]